MKGLAVFAVIAALLAACRGRDIPLDARILAATEPATAFAPDVPLSRSASAAVTVVDNRQYVIDGRRRVQFEGIWRNGVTVVYPKDTPTNQALATYIEDAVLAGFQHKSSNADRLTYIGPGASESYIVGQCLQASKDVCLVLIVNEWQYERFKRGLDFRYNTRVKVIDRNGKTLTTKDFAANVPVGEVSDAKIYLNMLHVEYKKALQEIFNDPVIASALKRD